MLPFPRRAAVVALTAGLVLILSLPASAAQRIRYRGPTSQDKRVDLQVLKRDGGRRILRNVFFFVATCEDASTHTMGIGTSGGRLDDDGDFEIHRPASPGEWFSIEFDVIGTVRFGSAKGTLEVTYPSLNAAGEAQLCTTGIVNWTADRRRSEPRRTMAAAGDEVTFIDVDRGGEVTMVSP